MKSYILTSSKFQGHIQFTYGDDELLVSYDMSHATLQPKQREYLLVNMPKTYQMMNHLVARNPAIKVSAQIKENVTFDEFWPMAYVNKGSSKKLSRKIWDKLPQPERDKAANHWPRYLRNKNDGEGIKYVETYLRSEIWNN